MAQQKLHEFQKLLLKKLTYTPEGERFNDLLIDGLESEHMNYHLQKLIELELVEKQNSLYRLTDKGKDQVNLMNDEITEVERQPKTSVLLLIARKNPQTQQEEFLVSKKLRQPYYGKVGLIGGKVRFGESLEEAVLRELFEETGYKAKSIKLLDVYHKIRRRENGETVQDILFYRFYVTAIEGSLIEETPAQQNFWATQEDLKMRDDLFDDFSLNTMSEYENKDLSFSESIERAKDF